MKKLMTMIAAVATAFGLFAADVADTGTSFEGAGAGNLADVLGSLTELNSEATKANYWDLGALTTEAAVTQFGSVKPSDRPEQYGTEGANNFFLELATGSAAVTRYAIGKDGQAASKYDVKENKKSLIFDSVVKFTAFEDAPEIDPTAKIAVWLQDTSDLELDGVEPATNLMVTVGNTTYNCGSAEAILDTWARVTIKAMMINDSQMGFVVYVDQSKVANVGTPIVYPTDLTREANEYAKLQQLFVATGTTIESVSFQGKGSVDDIVFTQTIPQFAKDAEFYTITGNDNVESFKVGDDMWTKGDAALEYVWTAAEEVAVTDIEYTKPGYFGHTSTNLNVVAAADYFVGDAKEANVYVTINGVSTPYATMEEAIAAANVGGAEIALANDYDASEETLTINNAAGETILDLAGNTLTGTVVYATALTVKDSSEQATGAIVPAAGASMENSAVSVAEGEWTEETEPVLTILSGKFDGALGTSINLPVIKGGKIIDDSEAEDERDFPYSPTGEENIWTIGDDTYEATWADNYWTVEKVTTCTVTINAGIGTKLAVKAGDEEVATGDKVKEGTELTITVDAGEGYKNAKVKVDGTELTGKTLSVDADVEITSEATAITYATLAVQADEGITYVLTNKTTEAVVEAGYKADIDYAEAIEAIEIAVTTEGYELDPTSVLTTTLNTATPAAIVLKKQLKTFAVTFSTNKIDVAEAKTTVQYGQVPTQIPTFTEEGTWDVDPATAVITCATNFNYTIKAEEPVEPVVPGADIKTDKTPADINADPTLKAELLKAPEGATVNLAVYNTYFDAAPGSEAGTVKFVLNSTGEAALQENVDDEIVKIKPDKIADGTATSVSIDPIPGFYYAIKQGNGIGTMKVIEAGVLATSDAALELKLTKFDGAGFYKVIVSEKPIAAEK